MAIWIEVQTLISCYRGQHEVYSALGSSDISDGILYVRSSYSGWRLECITPTNADSYLSKTFGFFTCQKCQYKAHSIRRASSMNACCSPELRTNDAFTVTALVSCLWWSTVDWAFGCPLSCQKRIKLDTVAYEVNWTQLFLIWIICRVGFYGAVKYAENFHIFILWAINCF